MCGIAGIIGLSDRSSLRTERMVKSLGHRGPDSNGIWNNGKSVSLGHTRLSILDLDSRSNQPFRTASGCSTLVYNGEVYNYHDLRGKLQGIPLKTSGDTEVVAELIEKLGIDALKHLNGMFALAHWNSERRELLLCRDPMGIKPLYVQEVSEGLIFASELRAIISAEVSNVEASREAVASFLMYGSVQGPQTILKGVQELEPGVAYVVDEGGRIVRRERFWDHKFPECGRAEEKISNDEVAQQIRIAVKSQLISDAPIGIFLSGGVDSTAVLSAAISGGASRLTTLAVSTCSGASDENDDVLYASAVARALETNHTTIEFGFGELGDLARLSLDYLDQPSIDGLNTFVVSKAARAASIKVALSGLGGDELFAGYPSFAEIPNLRVIQTTTKLFSLSKILSPFASKRKIGRLKRLEESTASISDLFDAYYSIRSHSEIAEILGAEVVVNKNLAIRNLSIDDEISYYELTRHMRNTMIRDTDAMSMSQSLEIRVPLLDLNLVNLIQNKGSRLRRTKTGKMVMGSTFDSRVPRNIARRRKQGFWMPMQKICGQYLFDFTRNHCALFDKRFDTRIGIESWHKLASGSGSETWQRIWSIVVLEYWLSKYRVTVG